jgi:hypothetical protein
VIAIAGSEIRPGMWIILEPGSESFEVKLLEPVGTAANWRRVSSPTGPEGLLHLTSWYAAVES